ARIAEPAILEREADKAAIKATQAAAVQRARYREIAWHDRQRLEFRSLLQTTQRCERVARATDDGETGKLRPVIAGQRSASGQAKGLAHRVEQRRAGSRLRAAGTRRRRGLGIRDHALGV